MSGEAQKDPFATTANPAAYVPRASCERALAAIAAALDEGASVVALSGPPGLGKTLLLRLLEPRLRGRRTLVYLPYAALPAADVCGWALAVLGRPAQGDTGAALAAEARDLAARGAPLVLVLDDGSAIPLATVRRLVDLAAEHARVLSLLVAVTDDEKSEAVLAALGSAARSVRLDAPLSAAESAAYVTERLARAGAADEVRRRFDPVMLDRLHRSARGIPRVLGRLASEVVRRGQEGLLAAELDEPALEPEAPPKRAAPAPQSPAAARVALLTAEGAGLGAGPPQAHPPRAAEARRDPGRPASPGAATPEPVAPEKAPGPRPGVPPAPQAAAPPSRASAPEPAAPSEAAAKAAAPARAPAEAAPAPARAAMPTAPQAPAPRRPPDARPAASQRVAAAPRRSIGPAQIFLVALVIGAAAIGIPMWLSRPQSPATTNVPEAAPQPAAPARPPAPPAPAIAQPAPPEKSSPIPAAAPAKPPPPPAPTDTATAALSAAAPIPKPAPAASAPTPSPAPSSATAAAAPAAKPPPAPAASQPSGAASAGAPSQPPAPAAKTPPTPSAPPATPAPPVPPAPTVAPATPAKPTVPPAPAVAPATPAKATQPPAPAAAAAPPTPATAPVAKPAPPVPVAINATPWATIEVDGREVGETPLAGVALTPGPHVFRARLADGRVLERTVAIDAKNRFVTFR